jgi:hypothetical protein
MNPEDLTLLHRHLNKTLSPEEHHDLEALLRNSADARATLRSLATIDSKWEQLSVPLPVEAQNFQAMETISRPKWKRFLPVPLSLAAGLVFALAGASGLWGIPIQKFVEQAVHTLRNGRFGTAQGPISSGFPLTYGKWSGDPARIVPLSSGPAPHALQFVAAYRESSPKANAARSCDVYQLVDLRPFRQKTDPAAVPALQLEADFLDARSEAGPPLNFFLKIHLFLGDPAARKDLWLTHSQDELAMGRNKFRSTGGSGTQKNWKHLTAQAALPSEADYAVVGLSLTGDQNSGPVSLGEQFVTNISLFLRTQPAQPPRKRTKPTAP